MDVTYKMKHLGQPKFMIGIKIDMNDTCIRLSQHQYIEHAAVKFGQHTAAPANLPAHPSGCLSLESSGDSPLLDPTTHPYLSLVGTLLWTTITRPDVQVAVSRACSHTQGDTMAHCRATCHSPQPNECVKDILWLRGLLREFGFTLDSPSVIHEDNQTTISMINNHLISSLNRHFCIRMA